jgi:hypothetical protein
MPLNGSVLAFRSPQEAARYLAGGSYALSRFDPLRGAFTAFWPFFLPAEAGRAQLLTRCNCAR